MKKKQIILLCLVGGIGFTLSSEALAFGCTSNGIYHGSGNSWEIPVAPPVLKKDTQSYVTITNMATYTDCSGNTSDNLRVYSASINSTLETYGFTGVVNINGTRFNLSSARNQYIWPYPLSSGTSNNGAAVKVSIELQRSNAGSWKAGTTLAKGTEIARFVAQQRSGSSWGWNDTWVFKLNAPLVIPAYTCNVTDSGDRTVKLSNVASSDLQKKGVGRYDKIKGHFSFNLDCDELTTVKLSYNGNRISGTDDVLANLESGNNNVGIQILPTGSNTASKVDGTLATVINSAQQSEVLDYDAYYYYKGGDISGGPVKSMVTYTFDYQ